MHLVRTRHRDDELNADLKSNMAMLGLTLATINEVSVEAKGDAVMNLIRCLESLKDAFFINRKGIKKLRCVTCNKMQEVVDRAKPEWKAKHPDMVRRASALVKKLKWGSVSKKVGHPYVFAN